MSAESFAAEYHAQKIYEVRQLEAAIHNARPQLRRQRTPRSRRWTFPLLRLPFAPATTRDRAAARRVLAGGLR